MITAMDKLITYQDRKLAEAEALLLGMAQDLREYADAAAEGGENIQSTEELLKEVDDYFGFGQQDDGK